MVLPGFHDSHLHMSWYGQKMTQIDLSKCSSIEQLKQKLALYFLSNPKAKWLEGYGWDQNLLGRYPLAEDLDEVCENVPVFLKRVCHHAAVINQTLLNLVSFHAATNCIPLIIFFFLKMYLLIHINFISFFAGFLRKLIGTSFFRALL